MTKIKYLLVSVDRCDKRVIASLTKEERKDVVCYAVNPKVKDKQIFEEFNVINEWELPWHDSSYQDLQYYEYGAISHMVKNPQLIEGLTHIGLLHYDVKFERGSVTKIKEELDKNPQTIFYNTKRTKEQLYFTYQQLHNLAIFMNSKMKTRINAENIWKNGWISEALSITPIDVFTKFGTFLLENRKEIDDILNQNRWSIMDRVKHRPCGFTERMWGIYLMSLNRPMKMMPIIHEQLLYEHMHLIDKQNFLNNLV